MVVVVFERLSAAFPVAIKVGADKAEAQPTPFMAEKGSTIPKPENDSDNVCGSMAILLR